MILLDPRAVVERAFDRLNAHDLDAYYSLFAEDVVYAGSTVRNGRDEARAFDQRVWEAVPDHWRRVEKLLVSGDTVAAWIRFGGTTERTGRRFELEFCDIIAVRDGSITSFVMYADWSAVLAALEMAPSS